MSFLDLILIAFLLFMFFSGYSKGFFATLYDLLSFIIREFDSCLQFFTNQIAQNVDYINAFEFFYCQIRKNKCTNMG